MIDDYVLVSIIGVIVTGAAILGTWYWNSRTRKDTTLQSRQTLLDTVEKTAKEKYREEQSLAQQLAKDNKQTAMEVKQDMKDHVNRLVDVLKGDIELQRVLAYSKMGEIDTRVAQLKIDLLQHIEQEKDERIRMQRSIDFLQTMNFGPAAKSIPEYMTGESETQEHKEEPDKGVFASRKDTTHKDTLDPVPEQDPNKEE